MATATAWKGCTKKLSSNQLSAISEGPGGKPSGPSCFDITADS